MIDKEFIEELRVLSKSEDKAEQKKAKDELADYAQSFGIKVKRTMTFENMVTFVEAELEKLSQEMNEEPVQDSDGIGINDLILASDEAEGKVIFEEPKQELVDAFKDEVVEESMPVEAIESIQEQTVHESKKEIEENSVPKTSLGFDLFSDEANHKLTVDSTSICDLTGFRPTINLIGGGRGYYTCPWWIFQWIMDNPDWKAHPERFPHVYVHDTLKSLIYYIKRDGSVKVRETKNSQFFTLK